jgi:hypothetical protein
MNDDRPDPAREPPRSASVDDDARPATHGHRFGMAFASHPLGATLGAIAGLAIGALIGLAAGPVGSLAGAIVGAVAGVLLATGYPGAGGER